MVLTTASRGELHPHTPAPVTQSHLSRRGAGELVREHTRHHAASHAPCPPGLLRGGGWRGRPSAHSAAPRVDVGAAAASSQRTPAPITDRSGVRGGFPEPRGTPRPGPGCPRLPSSPGFLLLQALGFWGWMPQSFGPRPLLPAVGAGRGVREVRAAPRGAGRDSCSSPKAAFYPAAIRAHRLVKPWAKSISLLSGRLRRRGKDENASSAKCPSLALGPRHHPHQLWPAGPLGRGLTGTKRPLSASRPSCSLSQMSSCLHPTGPVPWGADRPAWGCPPPRPQGPAGPGRTHCTGSRICGSCCLRTGPPRRSTRSSGTHRISCLLPSSAF